MVKHPTEVIGWDEPRVLALGSHVPVIQKITAVYVRWGWDKEVTKG